MKLGKRFLIVILIASTLLVGCNSGGGGPADDVPYRAKLYLNHEEGMLTEPASGRVTTTHYLSGGSGTEEWSTEVADQILADELTYSLIMASAGTTSIDLELILVIDGEEVVIAEDSYVIDSDRYMPYRGTLTPTEAFETEGETIILRMEASGSDFGIQYGGLTTYLSLFEAPELLDEVMEQRAAYITWLIDNISVGEESDVMSTQLFDNSLDQLDFAILREDNATWHIGWGLTNSETPYRLIWADNVFTAEELTMDQADEVELEEMQITFEIN
jgi:hypothetical protein